MNTFNTDSQIAVRMRRVGDPERIHVLPRHFGRIMLLVENSVYFWAGRLSSDYRGGFWTFYEFGRGGFYMAPDSESFRVEVEGNGFEGTLSGDAFGITCCLFAFSHLSFAVDHEALGRHYALLREFACEHAEARLIAQAID